MAKKIGKYIFPQVGSQTDKVTQAFGLLGLNACSTSFEFLIEKMQEDHGTMFDLLERLLELEVSYREEARVNRWIRQAQLMPLTTIKEFDFKKQPDIKPEVIYELASCRFLDEGKNVIFLGIPGVGKTHLSMAIGYEAIKKGYETKCMRLKEFENTIRRSTEVGLKRLHHSMVAPQLLIIDDIDYSPVSEQFNKFFTDVLLERYDNKQSTLITSNSDPKEWSKLLDPKRAKMTLDRLFDQRRVAVVNIKDGISYRVPRPLVDSIASLKSMETTEIKQPGVFKKIASSLTSKA